MTTLFFSFDISMYLWYWKCRSQKITGSIYVHQADRAINGITITSRWLTLRQNAYTQCTFRSSPPLSYFLPFRRSQRPCFGYPQFRDVTAPHVGCWLLAYILELSLSRSSLGLISDGSQIISGVLLSMP